MPAAAETSMDQEAATEAASQYRGREHQREAAECRGGGGAVAAASRRGRCFDDDDELPTTTVQRCRACAAVAIADCVALGCCPCAVVSLLGLALVKAPLVVGRRCVGRLRRRRRLLMHKKRVRDVAASAVACIHHEETGGKAEVVAPGVAGSATTGPGVEAELAWLEEMYRAGHWGFGRVSFSGES